MAVFSGSNAVSKSLIYQSGNSIMISPGANPNAFVIYNNESDATPFRVSTDSDYVYIGADTELIGSLIVSSNVSSSTANITTLTTGSTYPITSSWSNNATTASYALNASGGGGGFRTRVLLIIP